MNSRPERLRVGGNLLWSAVRGGRFTPRGRILHRRSRGTITAAREGKILLQERAASQRGPQETEGADVADALGGAGAETRGIRGGVETDHPGVLWDGRKAVEPLAVGEGRHPVVQDDANSRQGRLPRVEPAVPVEVLEDTSQERLLERENPLADEDHGPGGPPRGGVSGGELSRHGGLIGDRLRRRSGRHSRAVGNLGLAPGGKIAEGEGEGPSRLHRIDSRRAGPRDSSRGPLHRVQELGEEVGENDIADRESPGVGDQDPVADGLADPGVAAVGHLRQQQVAFGEERHVECQRRDVREDDGARNQRKTSRSSERQAVQCGEGQAEDRRRGGAGGAGEDVHLHQARKKSRQRHPQVGSRRRSGRADDGRVEQEAVAARGVGGEGIRVVDVGRCPGAGEGRQRLQRPRRCRTGGRPGRRAEAARRRRGIPGRTDTTRTRAWEESTFATPAAEKVARFDSSVPAGTAASMRAWNCTAWRLARRHRGEPHNHGASGGLTGIQFQAASLSGEPSSDRVPGT